MFLCDGKVMDMIMRQMDRQAREGEAVQRTDRENLDRKSARKKASEMEPKEA